MDTNTTWAVVDKLFGSNGFSELIQHQIESYKKFVFNNLEEVISGFNPIELQHKFNEKLGKHEAMIHITVKNPILARPVIYEKNGSVKPMTPYEARARNFTYSGNLYGDVSVEIKGLKEDGSYDTSTKHFRKVPLGKIPVMIGSEYCVLSALRGTIFDGSSVFTQRDAIEFMAKYINLSNKELLADRANKIKYVKEVLEFEFLPHGTIKEANDIVVGDHLIDDNGNAVRVKSSCSGFKKKYEVVPDKANFISHTVTENHVLTLKDGDDVVDITIEKYLSLPTNAQKNMRLFKSAGINWEKREVAMDPYIMGTWLGDSIGSTVDKELLAKYGLVEDKHIPLDYIVNDRATRLAVLAGLIDTVGNVRADGKEITISQGEKNYKIIYDAEFLAGSLGFSCCVNDRARTHTVAGEKRQKPYKSLYITGLKLHEIPTVLPTKKLNENKCNGFLQSSFKLVEKDVQAFVGWQVEGNGRFLLGDLSTSHNTPEGASVGIVKNMALTVRITSHTDSNGVRNLLIEENMTPFHPCMLERFAKETKVFVNGDLIGVHDKPSVLFAALKTSKRSGRIDIYSSIVWNRTSNEILVSTEAGQCVRPLYVMANGALILTPKMAQQCTWNQLICDEDGASAIEYMDVLECSNSMIAMDYKTLVSTVTVTIVTFYFYEKRHPSDDEEEEHEPKSTEPQPLPQPLPLPVLSEEIVLDFDYKEMDVALATAKKDGTAGARKQFPDSANVCGDAEDIVSTYPVYKPFLQPGENDNTRDLCNYVSDTTNTAEKRIVLGEKRLGKLTKWADAKCNQTKDVSARPNMLYNLMDTFSGNDIASISNGIEKNCPADYYMKEVSVADLVKERDADKLKYACDRASKYINADDTGKLFPEYEWSVPQKRPPVCVSSAKCTAHPSIDQTSLIGTLLSDAKNTEVGSIMPKFVYKETNF
eukprot:gene19624-26308_t